MPAWFLLLLSLAAASAATAACGVVTPTTDPPTYRDFGRGSQA